MPDNQIRLQFYTSKEIKALVDDECARREQIQGTKVRQSQVVCDALVKYFTDLGVEIPIKRPASVKRKSPFARSA